MYVDDVQRVDRVTVDRLVNEASRWGIQRGRAHDVVLDVLDRLPGSVSTTASGTVDIPEELAQLVMDNGDRLVSSVHAGEARSM